jgi:hypothetical protein
MHAVHLGPQAQERSAVGAPLPQHLADQHGWRELTASVTRVWQTLPPDERARAAIIADNYGEAAALDFYGAAAGLPPALSGHNQYWLWGTRGHDGGVVIVLNDRIDDWRRVCREVHEAGRFGAPYTMPYESDQPILVCHGMSPSLPALWPRFKFYR